MNVYDTPTDGDETPACEKTDGLLIHHDGTQYGPYPVAELQAMLADGTLNDQTLVWDEAISEWLPLASIVGLEPEASDSSEPYSPRLPPKRAAHSRRMVLSWQAAVVICSAIAIQGMAVEEIASPRPSAWAFWELPASISAAVGAFALWLRLAQFELPHERKTAMMQTIAGLGGMVLAVGLFAFSYFIGILAPAKYVILYGVPASINVASLRMIGKSLPPKA